jgi:isopentenyl-diphosphate delta-isomerase type 1
VDESAMDFVILVDENDDQIGIEDKIKAHHDRLLHRAFSIVLYRRSKSDLEILLQKRADKKYHCAGLWTNACCSHPMPGETVEAAAHRRLGEELGVQHTQLKLLNKFHYIAELNNGLIENEMDYVFSGKYDSQKFDINPDEISEVKWMSSPLLLEDLVNNSVHYTPWFKKVMEIFLVSCNA